MPTDKADFVQSLLIYLPDLLEGTDSSLLANFLKDSSEFSSTVLRGFRVTPRNVKASVVKQRLINEAEKSPELLEMLSILWVDSNKHLWSRIALGTSREVRNSLKELVMEFGLPAVRIALLHDDRLTVNRLASKVVASDAVPAPMESVREEPAIEEPRKTETSDAERLRDENRRLKEKARQADSQLRKLHNLVEARDREIKHSQSQMQSLKQQIAELKRELAMAEKMIDRLRRSESAAKEKKSVVETDLRQLRRQVQALESKPPPVQPSPAKPTRSRGPDWVSAISAMLNNGSFDAAREFCETLKETAPESLHARLALEHVYAKTNMNDKQVAECLWIAGHLNNRGESTRACAFACRALEADSSSLEAEKQLKDLIGRIRIADESEVSAVRGLLVRLKQSSPEAYRKAHAVVKGMGKKYSRLLQSQPEVLHVDKIVDLSDGMRSIQTSVRNIVEAVDANDVSVVEFIRCALSNLKTENPSLWRTIMHSLEAQDRSCVAALISGRQPVIVDGSNVAWHENRGRACLQHILDLRSELRSDGYFPVYIYVDAALPYQVDQRSALLKLIDQGAVVAVESRTDADEAITDQAKRLECPVVTNDRMIDWDPEGDILKFRFAIDNYGVTVYDG